MLDLLDKALEMLFNQELPSVHIYFDAPDDKFGPTLPAIDLFLYDVRENRELRSNEWIVQRQTNGQVTKQRPPVRVECAYLITAWASDARDEHKLLGQVIQTLVRYSTLPDAILPDGLQGQEPPLPATTLQPSQLQSMSEFWQALGGKPKAALTYTVTIAVPAGAPITAGPAVTDSVINKES